MKFKPENFSSFNEIFIGDDALTALQLRAANLANAKLEEMLKDAQVVYQTGTSNEWWPHFTKGDTHKAKLVCIEEIK